MQNAGADENRRGGRWGRSGSHTPPRAKTVSPRR